MKKNLEKNMQRRYKYNKIEAKLYQPINEKTIRKKNVSIQVKIPHKESEENISKNQKVLTKETGTHTEMRGVQADPTNNGGTEKPPTTEKNVKANIAEQTKRAEQNTIDIQTGRAEQKRIETNHYQNDKAEDEIETELLNKENEVKMDTKNMKFYQC